MQVNVYNLHGCHRLIILNTGSNNYNCTFPAMIDDWREKWHTFTIGQTDPMFGFGFVQVKFFMSCSCYWLLLCYVDLSSWHLLETVIRL